MSRAFVKENDAEEPPRTSYALPDRDDPAYEGAAAAALLQGARVGDTAGAEVATGFRWADPRLAPHIQRLLESAIAHRDDRLQQVAERYLRQMHAP